MSATAKVVIAGASVGPFGRFPERSLADLAQPVVHEALRAAEIKVSEIEAAFVGNAFAGTLSGQESILGQTLLAPLGIAGVPVHTIKNACSSGSDAVHLGWSAIAYGQYQCVLVLGAEKLDHPDKERALAALASATDHAPVAPGRSVFMDVNADRAKRYMAVHGAAPKHFAMVASKNRAHAALNDKAAMRSPIAWQDVLADRVVVAPLTRAMCGGLSDGAAAVVLCSETYARRKGLDGPTIVASAVVSGVPGGDAQGNATRRASVNAFTMSGIEPRDISLAEVHDPTAPQELLDIEELGLVPPGGGVALVERNATSLGGALPINVSGGLIARGHPVGATGVAQIAELAEQLRGRAGKRQVEGAKLGLAQMAGGLLGRDSAIATVHILARS